MSRSHGAHHALWPSPAQPGPRQHMPSALGPTQPPGPSAPQRPRVRQHCKHKPIFQEKTEEEQG